MKTSVDKPKREGSYHKPGICPICEKEYIKNAPNQTCCVPCREERNLLYKEIEDVGRFTIFSRDDFRCVYCGRSPIEHNVVLFLDHVVPYSSTKDNSIYNLVTCCGECNIGKNIRHLSPEVYKRIVERNKIRNKGISKKMEEKLNDIFERWYTIMK